MQWLLSWDTGDCSKGILLVLRLRSKGGLTLRLPASLQLPFLCPGDLPELWVPEEQHLRSLCNHISTIPVIGGAGGLRAG